MHDKAKTKADFENVLTHHNVPVQLHFYYPKTHYVNRPVPASVEAIMEPLDLSQVVDLDAFVITGSPIDTLDFAEVAYIDEIRDLLAALQHVPNKLYLCWGAMAALYLQYHIDKYNLPQKVFGAFAQDILQPSPLLAGLEDGFMAPHARYAESKMTEILAQPQLIMPAKSQNDDLFLVQNLDMSETFLFSHLEYGRTGLQDEYIRETTAHPDRHYLKPEMPSADVTTMTNADFPWQHTQAQFFDNWLKLVQTKLNSIIGGNIYGQSK